MTTSERRAHDILKDLVQQEIDVDPNGAATAAYIERMTAILDPAGGDARATVLTMMYITGDSTTSMAVKRLLVFRGHRFFYSKLWSLENFEDVPLQVLMWKVFPPRLDESSAGRSLYNDRLLALAKNKAITEKTLDYVLRHCLREMDRARSTQVIVTLVNNLNDFAFKKHLGYLLMVEQGAKSALERARKLYDLDVSVPDEWIRKMLT